MLLILFGWGIGTLLEQNKVLDYFNFVSIGLIVYCVSNHAFLATLRVFNESKESESNFKLFVNSPIPFVDIIYGQILWIFFQCFILSLPLIVMSLALGLLNILFLPFTLFVLLMIASTMVFLAVLITNYCKTEQLKAMVITLVILPMTWLTGIFFPIKLMPEALKYLAMFSPVYHAQTLIRAAGAQQINSQSFISLGLLFFISIVGMNLAIHISKKRFIKDS